MEDDEIGGARSTYERWEMRTLWSENLKGRDHVEDLDLEDIIILKLILIG
jgi:hypothetical protein